MKQSEQISLRQLPAVWMYAGVVAVSLVANWFIPLSYYLLMKAMNPQAFSGERTLLNYTTGFIGDFVLLPIMNVAIFFILLHSRANLRRLNIYHIIPFGIGADVLLHFLQGRFALTNWSMPKPFAWNFVSYWHMISFFFQISFVFLFFYIVGRQMYAQKPQVVRAVQLVFGVIALFIALFLLDYLPIHDLTGKLVAVLDVHF